MPSFSPEIQGMNIVLVGDFNPKIFQPAWFAAQGLIGEHEGEVAEIEIIHADITIFKLEWLRIQVTRDRFDASTTQDPYFEVLRDLVSSTFRILEHTPLRMLGINHHMHYRMSSVEKWHELGHRLAPKQLWNKVLEAPGMKKVSIQGIRPDGFKGNILVSVEPSSQIKNGAYFATNDHYEIDANRSLGASEIIQILDDNWKSSIERSSAIPENILGE